MPNSGLPVPEVVMSARLDADSVRSMTVDQLQRQLIAERLGVDPEDITSEFLDDYLEKHVYPNARLVHGSQFGGYDNSHLRVLTRAEFDKIRQKAELLFAEALAHNAKK